MVLNMLTQYPSRRVQAMMGVAATTGKLDIDRPLHEYGISASGANWSVFGTDYYPNVTTRHLLGQSSGYANSYRDPSPSHRTPPILTECVKQ